MSNVRNRRARLQAKLGPLTILSWTRGHTPKNSTPLSSQQDSALHPHLTSAAPLNHQPSELPPPCHLHSQWLAVQHLANCWLAFLPFYLLDSANGNPGYSGKGGVHSSRKQQQLGGRGSSSCYTFCESEHMEGKGKESRPTHPQQLENSPLLSYHSVAVGLHTVTRSLIYLINIQGLWTKRPHFSSAPFFHVPPHPPFRGRNLHVTF